LTPASSETTLTATTAKTATNSGDSTDNSSSCSDNRQWGGTAATARSAGTALNT
jgi:hypothetical protein